MQRGLGGWGREPTQSAGFPVKTIRLLKAPTDYTKPQKRVYKAPTDSTEPQQTLQPDRLYKAPKRSLRKTIQRHQNITQRHNILDKDLKDLTRVATNINST